MKTYNKKLYKSKGNRVLAGVIGGIGEYFGVDPTLLRVAYIIITFFTGLFPGTIAYIFMALVVPEKPGTVHEEAQTK
jgi:phage shock protein C